MTMQYREQLRETLEILRNPRPEDMEVLNDFARQFNNLRESHSLTQERRLRDTMKMYNLFPVSAEYIANRQHETRRRPVELGARFRPGMRRQDRECFELIEQVREGKLLPKSKRDSLPVNLPDISPAKLRSLKSSAGRVLIGALPSTSNIVTMMSPRPLEVLSSNVYDLDKVIATRIEQAYDLYYGEE